MDPRLLYHYNRELQHVREMGAEFAVDYPKIAGRLGMSGIDCADPYVERLLEGFAFMAARVQLELEGQQPAFAAHLLEMLYPHYLAPIPSMAVVQMFPEEGDSIGPEGHLLPRNVPLRSLAGAGDRTACEYRTAHDVTLWPLSLTEAGYFGSPAAMAAAGVPVAHGARACVRLKFRLAPGMRLDMLKMDALPLYIAGADGIAGQLYEQIHGNALGYLVRGIAESGQEVSQRYQAGAIGECGFNDDEALLPVSDRSFSGYRLLQEYFACQERFSFMQLTGLQRLFKRAVSDQFDVMIWFDRAVERLESAVSAANFRLFCTPAVNLFPRRGDRIHLQEGQVEYHVLADRTRPMDFEVHSVVNVEGYGDSQAPLLTFEPFYGATDRRWHDPRSAFFSLRRVARKLSGAQRRDGTRSSYVGNEIFLSLVDSAEAPFSHDLRELGVELLCSNRDLPLHMPVGRSTTDFTLDLGGPVASIRCVAGPSRPRSAAPAGQARWRLISHLQLNYLSLLDSGDDGAVALREMLSLYHDPHDATAKRQVEGLRSARAQPIVRRLPIQGPATYGRGLEVILTCEESAYEGQGAYLLASVLRHLLARQVSMNSFTETVLHTFERNEVARWPATLGNRQIL